MGFFSPEEVAGMSSGLCPPAPRDYILPTRFPSMKGAARIAWDWETKDPNLTTYGNGVYRKDGFIVGGSIAAWDNAGKLIHAEYYPMRHRGGPNLDPDKVISYFADQLNFFEGELTGANLMYEGDWGQSVGITPVFAKWRDVQWAEAILDEMAHSYKLENIAKKYFNRGKVTDELKLLYGPDYIKRFDEVHPGHARAYGVGDVLLPNAILNAQYKELEALGLRELFELESRLTPFLLYLRRQGVRMDMDKAARFKEELTVKIQDRIKLLRTKTGLQFTSENFNNKKFLTYVFDRLGIVAPRAAKGDLSVTDKFLHHLCSCQKPDKKDPRKMVDNQECGCVGRLLESCNKYQKVIGTFIEGYVFDYAVDGRVHGEFHPLRKADDNSEYGSETGRFSGSNPNLQNIPARDEELGPMCRSMFVPEIGAEWWSADYCVAPDTKVLGADLKWYTAFNVMVGQELVGFDEDLPSSKPGGKGRRRFKGTHVVRTRLLRQPCVRITTNRGSVVCSTKHRWLSKKYGSFATFKWVESGSLKVGDAIPRMCSPWEERNDYAAGYVAGILDGEGHLSCQTLGFAQKPGIVTEEVLQYTLAMGFDFRKPDAKSKMGVACPRWYITGGRPEILRCIGETRPKRLLSKARHIWDGTTCQTKAMQPDKIIAIEFIGEQDVVAIQTDASTFIANGLLSHNSQIEYRYLAHMASIMPALKGNGEAATRRQKSLKSVMLTIARYQENPDTDFHQALADLVSEALKTVFPRGQAKNLNFGLVYGMGLAKLARDLNMLDKEGKPTQECKDLMETYHTAAPFVKDLYDLCIEEAATTGEIRTILNRRRQFEFWQPRKREKGTLYTELPFEQAINAYGFDIERCQTHKALNTKLQGSAADQMKMAMVLAWEAGVFTSTKDFTCSLTIHDELDGSIFPTKRGEEAHRELVHIMANAIKLNLPVLVGVGRGTDWSKAK